MSAVCPSRKSGQAMVFLVAVLAILASVVVWNFDLHKTVMVKVRSQHAGDAAALAGARWQGIALNLMGELNIAQALAVMDQVATGSDDGSTAAIGELEARLAYAGPMIAFAAAQQAAKNNGMYVNTGFADRLRKHARSIREDYPELFEEPFPGAWSEYADMLDLVVSHGIAVAPENFRGYSDYGYDHILLQPAFYEAVAGKDWCWFFWNHLDLLQDYTTYTYWDPLPIIVDPEPVNSEIFGLSLTRMTTLDSLALSAPPIAEAIDETTDIDELMEIEAAWYAYNAGGWTAWDALHLDNFPASGNLKPQYDYSGADSATRVGNRNEGLLASGGSRDIAWTSAAKPFGHLETEDGPVPPHRYGLVLPAFTDLRLIPLDGSSAAGGGGYDLTWREHIEDHLPIYMASGPRTVGARFPNCFYCRQLVTWEPQGFRDEGILWLSNNDCPVPPPGGPGGGGDGGTRRGH